MSNKLKKTAGKKAKADPKKADPKVFKQEKEENINWKKLARDERTWKITGTLFLLIAAFLLIAFISYFFTWKEDQDKVFRGGYALLMDNDIKVSNLLGRLGALVSHFFIYKGFGIASLLICTFFFVVGTNLLYNMKVFSIWRNLKYVTIGLLVLSVSLAFVLTGSDFPFGGGAGAMISNWLIGIFGNIGTAALLLVVAFAYFIWQFNPTFKTPVRNKVIVAGEADANDQTDKIAGAIAGKTINEKYAEGGIGNSLKGDAAMIDLTINDAAKLHDLKIVEKDDPAAEPFGSNESSIEKEMVSDMLHK
jgi:S-DNA-T family DNA segregation ATPase FtsK/SpoIIIE